MTGLKFLVSGGLILILIIVVLVLIENGETKQNLDDFAQCLTEKGFIMYGSANCPHCLAEKRAFGSSFRHVSYVECTEDPDRCIDENIDGVPTWITSSGGRYIGAQGLSGLSEISGCVLE